MTALLLLLNFFISPILIAFPKEECNAVCEITSNNHECSVDKHEQMEMSCCEKMEMNSNVPSNSSDCEMQITDINCALVSHSQINSSFLVPKSIDNKVEFVNITTIDFGDINPNIEILGIIQDYSYRDEPPIYLINSVFLI